MSVQGVLLKISTHVPTRGTTRLDLPRAAVRLISTHVPTRGTTKLADAAEDAEGISTHVPTRGTTSAKAGRETRQMDFNPRPHAGDDQAWKTRV